MYWIKKVNGDLSGSLFIRFKFYLVQGLFSSQSVTLVQPSMRHLNRNDLNAVTFLLHTDMYDSQNVKIIVLFRTRMI